MALQVKPVAPATTTPSSRISPSSGSRGVASGSRAEVDGIPSGFNVGPQDEQVLQQDFSFRERDSERQPGNRFSSQSVAFAYELHEAEQGSTDGSAVFTSSGRSGANLPPYEIARGIAVYENNINTIANGGRSTGSQLSYAI
ncbi:MAG: hypothetical protein RIC36_15740 [Rhodospirillales bacterium]